MAARTFLSDDLVGQRIPLTGPRSLTNVEMIDIIGSVLHRPLRYNEIPAELVRQRFTGLGFPAEFGDAYVAMLASTLDVPATVTDDVARILGRPAESFEQWVSEHIELFTN